jgi:nickel-dependent lactate racemase
VLVASRNEIALRTGVWYDDRPITLSFPEAWDVKTYWPDTPAPLSDREIADRFASPIGQPPLRELARGRRRPVVVVDDLARPTPVCRVMPFVLDELRAAGIGASAVRVLVAAGTHGHQDSAALANKLGHATASVCRVIVHDDTQRSRLMGRTSFGTPVYPNTELLDADLVVGIGGVYPQHATGFGGGAKLALGVMERRTIRTLHFSHRGVAGTYDIDNDFRRDVTEVARMIGMRTVVTVHVNAQLDVVSVMTGDHEAYYPQAAAFSRQRYDAPPPHDADVVVANTYPSDISYTFMRKGMKPIRCAPADAIRLVVGSNTEGLGHHGLFQQGLSARLEAYRMLYNRVRIMDRRVIAQKIAKHVGRAVGIRTSAVETAPLSRHAKPRSPIWLYRPPGVNLAPMPPLDGVTVMSDWGDIVARIASERGDRRSIRVRVYPCASLQCLDAPEDDGEDSD